MIDPQSAEPVTLNGSCHCGAVQFSVKLTEGFASARRCTCSMCRMRGAVAVTSTPADFALKQGADQLATYRFNTRTAEHHFCSKCGIYTHHKRRSNPNQLGVNVACLDGVSPFDFKELLVFDGERHPADNADHKTYVAGVLRFEPAEG
ncbi:GFA family protein [Sphingomonas limnosediminicola]|uniref:GFA family protein n=1 Tax=Sphingomonas limnosediminicola TaxID=940133 RepID=A0ABP7KWW4_9SPHN